MAHAGTSRSGAARAATLSACLSALLALAGGCSDSPTDPREEDWPLQIAFVSDRDGGEDFYLMAVDDTGLVRLTSDPDIERFYEWSPDGTRLVVGRTIGTNDLWVVNADGSGLRRLTNSQEMETSPRWSPDGKRIAFSMFRSMSDLYTTDIWVVGADGTGLTNLTRTQTYQARNAGPEWSPDGKRILFYANRRVHPDNDMAQIYVMNADGSAPQQLSKSLERYHSNPQWSPDGTRILFSLPVGVCGTLHVMKTDGTGVTDVTSGPDACDRDARWSPDGTMIAFQRRDPAIPTTYDGYVVRADGTGLVNVTAHPANDGALSWSPDGSLLAFTSMRAGTEEIFLVKPDGSGLRRLTDSPSGGSWLDSSGAFRPVR